MSLDCESRRLALAYAFAVLVGACGDGSIDGPGGDGGASDAGSGDDGATDAAGADGGSPDAGPSTLDPAGCTPLTDAELRDAGYEPVRAHGAVGDGITDDTAAIQAAIATANENRRVVYLHPGTYLVSDTLEFRQDVYETRNNDGVTRFGQMLLGSYCGTEKPTIRLADGTATETDEQTIAAEPFPILLLWRPTSASSPGPDDSNQGRDWNQVVRNVRLVLGDNPGAVGIRHDGAEGCSAQEVTIDATGGFAGFYMLNGSGGYTYNVEVIGGKYGIYQEKGHGGAVLVVGIKLSGQEHTPIALGGYTPFGLVGFEITHDDGRVISAISGSETNHTVDGKLRTSFHDSGGHVFLVDGRIEITGGSNATLANTDRSVYLRDVYVKGRTDVLVNDATSGRLRVSDPAVWSHVGEFAYSGPYGSLYGEPGNLIAGASTDETYYDGALYATTTDITVTDQAEPPADLIARHTYRTALCNVEGAGVVWVTEHGADANDPADDTAAIQAAIDAAASGSNRVFLPAGHANAATGAMPNLYRISGTLSLGEHTRLCGVTRYSSVLDATAWAPAADSPVIETVDAAGADTAIADFKIQTPNVSGSQTAGYDPHVYAIDWRAGRNSLYRDVYCQRQWGDPGDGRTTVIRGNGGGRWYGVTQHGGFLPPDVDPGPDEDRPFEDSNGDLVMSPDARQMLIDGTHEPLRFYPYHCQHMTQPGGALCEIRNASHVTIFGIKSEMGSVPEQMSVIVNSNPADLVPVWMFITNSSDIALIGHEGMPQTAAGRGVIEISGSSDITIASMGRRGNGIVVSSAALPQDQWYFAKEQTGTGANTITAQGFLSLFKSE